MTRHAAADAIVIGGGLVGLACAWAIADRGIPVVLISERRPGEASPAAAGMLAPGVERGGDAAHDFAVAARDRHPSFVETLTAATGRRVPILRNGIIELALDEREADSKRRALPPGSSWLEPSELAALEPALSRSAGALFHPHDGAVDNVALLGALERCVEEHPSARLVRDAAVEVTRGRARGAAVGIRTARGEAYAAGVVVVAAGAWVHMLAGLPRPLPVEPVRGQMLAFHAAPLGHVTYGPHGYVVPRGDVTVAGSTMEYVGFEIGTTSEGAAAIRAAAAEICPPLARVAVRDQWSGLRPATPDLLPIIGREPMQPALVYACGHSRNGVLLAPLTGDCVGALVAGDEPPHDLTAFDVERFRARDDE